MSSARLAEIHVKYSALLTPTPLITHLLQATWWLVKSVRTLKTLLALLPATWLHDARKGTWRDLDNSPCMSVRHLLQMPWHTAFAVYYLCCAFAFNHPGIQAFAEARVYTSSSGTEDVRPSFPLLADLNADITDVRSMNQCWRPALDTSSTCVALFALSPGMLLPVYQGCSGRTTTSDS